MQSSHELPGEVTNRVVLVDGPAEARVWLDSFLRAVVAGEGNIPHPHPDIPAARVTFEQLRRAIAESFAINGRPWSVEEDGYPPVPGGLPMEADPGIASPGDDPGTLGSASHNLLHRLLGDFH